MLLQTKLFIPLPKITLSGVVKIVIQCYHNNTFRKTSYYHLWTFVRYVLFRVFVTIKNNGGYYENYRD